LIAVEGLRKAYGSTVAVDDLSFEVPDGQVTGFLGPNGSGKSTSMRLMLGLDFGSGETHYDGASLRKVDRRVGPWVRTWTPRASTPSVPHATTTDARQEAKVSNARVDEVIDELGLASVAKKGPGAFSLGMAQRLGLAGAILAQPRNLILDEPANGLDPQSIHWLRDYLRAYAAQGNAVLVSSHLLSEMQLMAERVVVIAKGRLIADDSMAALVARADGSSVSVRTESESVPTLRTALTDRGFEVAGSDDELSVKGATTEQIGRIAFEIGVPIFELSQHQASLESVFLELTDSEQGFRTGGVA